MNKTQMNHIVFYSGFKVMPTIKDSGKTIYTLKDVETNIDICLHLVFIDDVWSVNVICGDLDKLSTIGRKRWLKVVNKLQSYEDLVLNINPESFTEEEIKKLDQICVVEGIDIEAIESEGDYNE